MKILHMPLNVPGSEQVGQEKGFRQVFGDENYRNFDYLTVESQNGKQAANDMLLALIADWRPDIVWYQRQETDTITPQTIKTIREKYPELWLTTWSGDARDYAPRSLTDILPFFDIFYNDTDQIEMYKPHLGNCRYEFMPIAVDPDEATDYSHPTGSVPVPEIIFIGNEYGNTFSNGLFRKELMMALTKEFGDRFGVYGTGWSQGEVNWLGLCPVKHQGAYYHKAKVVISVDHIKGITHWSERLIWAMASETPVVIENQRGFEVDRKWAWDYGIIDGYYGDIGTVHLFAKGDVSDCIRKIYGRLSHSEPIFEKFTRNAKQAVLNKNTWKQRAEQVKLDYESK